MRTWEIEDSRSLSADMVHEQDFVLSIRRLNRIGKPNFVVNIILSLTDAGGRGILETAQERVKSWAESQGATASEMSNGDLFLIKPGDTVNRTWAEQAVKIAWPEGLPPEKTSQTYLAFRLPADYAPLRERVGFYMEQSRKAPTEDMATSPTQLLQTEAARGPLTAWSTGQIERLLDTIDLYRYVRRQPVCERLPDGQWKAMFNECYIGFESLRLDRFPKLEMDTTSHLFLALCQALDQHLLRQMLDHPERLDQRGVFLNLSISSIMGSNFARLVNSIPRDKRGLYGFELHRGDIFNDFVMTENAISLLKKEGFKVSIDSVSPHVLPYLNLHLLNVDYIKINVAKDRAGELNDLKARHAINLLPREKIIFFRCDSEAALMAGLAFGINKFQGWLIDDYLHASIL